MLKIKKIDIAETNQLLDYDERAGEDNEFRISLRVNDAKRDLDNRILDFRFEYEENWIETKIFYPDKSIGREEIFLNDTEKSKAIRFILDNFEVIEENFEKQINNLELVKSKLEEKLFF